MAMRRMPPRRRKQRSSAGEPAGPVAAYKVHLPPSVAADLGRDHFAVLGLTGDVSVAQVIGRTGWWEPHVMEAIVRHLPPGGAFVDVGANIGVHSVLGALRVGSEGHVLALEASPITHSVLAQNLAGTGCPGAVAVNVGVWNKLGPMRFRHLTSIVGGSHITVTGKESPWDAQAFTVLCAPLDVLVNLAGLERVDLIKIDVEGSEFQVLDGARETLKRDRPALILEYNSITAQYFDGRSAADLHQLVRDLGYQITFLAPDLASSDANDYQTLERIWNRGLRVLDVICLPD